MTLWDFAVERYRREGVREALLSLQDVHGQSVVLLLWRLWALDRILDPPVLAETVAISRAWETTIVGPLRAARRAARIPPGATAVDPRLHDGIAMSERRAEGRLCEILEGMTPPARGHMPDALETLRETAALWGDPPPARALIALTRSIAAPIPRARDLPGREALIASSERANARITRPMTEQGVEDGSDAEVRRELARLRQQHEDLDAAVHALETHSTGDQLRIARLKKQKLLLRDRIATLDDRLTPDIIA